MNEKDMVNDVLSMTKASLNAYETAISETSNQQLRSALQQLRDDAEQFHYDLYQRAEQLGYYQPAQKASSQEVQQLKSQLSQGNTTTPNMGMGGNTSGNLSNNTNRSMKGTMTQGNNNGSLR